ncbi:MAG: protein kinase [Planctomycetia bacterium]|nr:protein kinase [Planctomycetia bacterium]
MNVEQRYEIICLIGQGDFAAVYKARDRELGREVAVKQIHRQFLADPKQLERYWQEAQLLAALEHPNVMTIYDIVRPMGWLVLELMQGSLKEKLAGQPMNLEYLRLTLFHCLHALKFLHSHGIIHGDVKPGNLMIDRRNRVKIGDFGLARRAASSDGSLLKGATKYMAPEVFGEQFGPVTPASDLYSLGFSAYELLCGEHFESLFPGLGAFGRDKQLAWIMWHSAPDRRLPEIKRVMEGVPEDLARVIERLIEKDPAKRYKTADQALADLVYKDQGGAGPSMTEEDEQARAKEVAAKRKKRVFATAAIAASLLLTLTIFFFGGGGSPKVKPFDPIEGIVDKVELDQNQLVVASGPKRDVRRRVQAGGSAEIYLNERRVDLRDLQKDDEVRIERQARKEGDAELRYFKIAALRPQTNRGRIREIGSGKFHMSVDEGPDRGTSLELQVAKIEIVLNGDPAKFEDLRAGDFVTVTYTPKHQLRYAGRVVATRAVAVQEGVVRNVDSSKQEITYSRESDGSLVTLPYKPDCEVTVNKLRFLAGAIIQPEELQPGDRILKIVRDTHIQRIDVHRTFTVTGTARAVRSEEGTPSLDVAAGDDERFTFRVGPQCEVRLGAETVALAEVHTGDQVVVTHDSPDQKNLDALSIEASRPSDPTRFALLIAIETYDDKNVTPLPTARADAKQLQDALVRRYAVEPDHAVVLVDPSRIRLEQDLPDFLAKAAEASQLLVYFHGHAFVDDEQRVYLAPRDFALNRMDSSGLPLKSLVDQLEASSAREKVLLLDTAHAVKEDQVALQPSTARLVEAYKKTVPTPALRTLTVVASCSQDQRAVVRPDHGGLFAETIALALTGRADKNADNRLNTAELFEFARGHMAGIVGVNNARQTPELFLPNVDLPRLTEEAKKTLRTMVSHLGRERPNPDDVNALFDEAQLICGREPEPRLLQGLLLLKAKQYDDALAALEESKASHPPALDAQAGIGWLHFSRQKYVSGLVALIDMAKSVPEPKRAGQEYDPHALAVLKWAGVLREYADSQLDDRKEFGQLDAAVAEHGQAAQQAYAAGRAETRKKLMEFEAKIRAAGTEQEQNRIRFDRMRIAHYAAFDFDAAGKRILAGLDK